MKRRFPLLMLLLALLLVAALTFTACGGGNDSAEEDDDETAVDYPVGYFFAGDEENEDYVLTVPEEQLHRQVSAQYASAEVIRRASIMVYFNAEQNEIINRMWIRVRCFNILDVPVWVWIALAAVITAGILFGIQRKIAKERQYR